MHGAEKHSALILIASLLLFGCATNQRASLEQPQSADEISIAEEVRTAPFLSEKPRSIEEQRRLDSKKKFPDFAKLEFRSDSERAMHHFALGQAYSLNGETEKAIEDYRITLIYDPNSALVHSRLAAELVKIGRFPEAKKLCQKAMELDPKYTDAHLLLAGIHVVSKEYDEALRTYERVLKFSPQHRDALLYYGTTLAETGRLDTAVDVLERLTKLDDDPNSQVDGATAWFYLAKIEAQRERYDQAIRALKQSLKLKPEFSKPALLLADIYLAQDQQDKSIKVLEEAFRENANPGIAARLAAYCLAKSQFKKAVPYLETVVENDADNMSARVRLALVYWQIDWLDKAFDALAEVRERYPESSEVTFYLGELELERKRPESALGYFQAIGPEYSRYEDSVTKAVSALVQLDRKEEARSYVSSAIAKKADIVSFYTIFARLQEEDGKVAQAIQFLETNRNRINGDENALYYLGYLYDRVGDKKSGIAVMEKILQKNPENANALNYLGYALLEDGKDLDRAERYIVKAFELKPNDPYIIDSYGWLLFQRGNAKGALKQIERAVELKSDEGVILEHLADIYLDQNMKRKAYSAYARALEKMQDPKEQARVQQKLNGVASSLGLLDRRLPASAKPELAKPSLESSPPEKPAAEE